MDKMDKQFYGPYWEQTICTQRKVGCMAAKSNFVGKNMALMYLRYIPNDTLKWLKNARLYGSINGIFDVSLSKLQPKKETQMGKSHNVISKEPTLDEWWYEHFKRKVKGGKP